MGKITNALKKVMKEREQKTIDTSNIREPEECAVNNGPEVAAEKKRSAADSPSQAGSVKESLFESPNHQKGIPEPSVEGLQGFDHRIVSHFNYASPISEQYRILRTNIKSYFRKNVKQETMRTKKYLVAPKVITVTSSMHGEGKTLTCVNLAVTLAKEVDNKVLLIDADLRNGTVHKLLGIEETPGLSDVLSNEFDYSVGLQKTPIKNLFVIPRGSVTNNPSELFGSKKMRFMLNQLKAEPINYVIIDTPPVIPFTDAQVLSSLTHAVLLVVQAHRTPARMVERAKSFVEQAQGRILGFVLTQMDNYVSDWYSAYYYRYYHRNSMVQEKGN